jgi:predicted nucleotidyltransferase
MVNESIIKLAEQFVSLIPKDLGVKKSYLFGSYAKGEEREESDIDIAIVLENITDFYTVQLLLMKLRRKLDLRIEPHPISASEFVYTNPFAYEIKNTGIEIAVK